MHKLFIGLVFLKKEFNGAKRKDREKEKKGKESGADKASLLCHNIIKYYAAR